MMKNRLFLTGMLVLTLTFGLLFSGCATTTQVTFTTGEAPQGELKYVVIKATATGNGSALQRFYTDYPREKYHIVSCELINKNWLPVVGVMSGSLLGLAIGVPAAMDSDSLESGMAVGLGMPALGAGIGWLITNYFTLEYIITYVEKDVGPQE